MNAVNPNTTATVRTSACNTTNWSKKVTNTPTEYACTTVWKKLTNMIMKKYELLTQNYSNMVKTLLSILTSQLQYYTIMLMQNRCVTFVSKIIKKI